MKRFLPGLLSVAAITFSMTSQARSVDWTAAEYHFDGREIGEPTDHAVCGKNDARKCDSLRTVHATVGSGKGEKPPVPIVVFGGGNHMIAAPEIDPNSALGAMALLLGSVAVLRGRRRI